METSTWWYPTAFSAWDKSEYAAMDRVIKSDRFTMGPEVAAFEREFAAYHGVADGIMVNSGSSANLVATAALLALGHVKRGDIVGVPAIAWSTTYAPLVQHGLTLHVVDVDLATWNVDWLKLRQGLKRNPFVNVSILGNPSIAPRQAFAIEDNCESLGAIRPDGTRCGTDALMNTFSFFHSHQISAIEGGMILTDNSDCARMCRILRAHGWTRDTDEAFTFDQEYNFVEHGYNVRPTEMHAAIARVQLDKLPRFVAARRHNLATFVQMTADLPVIHQETVGQPSPFGLAFRVESQETRLRLVRALRARSIDCRLPTGGSFRLHPYRNRADAFTDDTPNADRIHRTGLFLGNAPFDIADRMARAVAVMREVL
jgi:CDP-4-dehydro-6-deoxyglucose reductase, E1